MLIHGHMCNYKRSPEYISWMNMKARCNNPGRQDFCNYGGRGIKVCAEWGSFDQFIKDMGCKPSPKHSLDRIKNELGYSKDNCRWATDLEQGRNKRSNKAIEYMGITYSSLSALAEATGCIYKNLSNRLIKGWSLEEAITKAPQKTYVRSISVR